MYKFSITPTNGFSFAALTGLVESDEELHDKIIKHMNIYFSDGYKNVIIHDNQIFYHNVSVGHIEYEGKLNFFQDLKSGLKKAIRYIKMPYRWSDND